MKKYFILLTFLFLLFSCNTENNETNEMVSTWSEMQDFLIDTKSYKEFDSVSDIKKSWKIISASDLTLASQATWKVSLINFKEWDKVNIWDTIIRLEDNISNYWINVERARNSLDRAKINYDSTLLSLNKSITDAQIAYDKAKIDHETLFKNLEVTLNKAEYDYWVSKENQDVSLNKTDLDLQKLEQNLAKQELDYNNSITNDNNTLNWFEENLKSTKKSIELVYFDMIKTLDEIFWVTDNNEVKNDSYEMYLSAKDKTYKLEVENKLETYINEYKDFENSKVIINSDSDYISYLNDFEDKVEWLKNLADLSKLALKNSIASSSFSQTTIDTYYSTVNSYSNSLQSTYSSLLSLKTNINSFLNTYLVNRESKEKALEIARKDVEIAKKQLSLSDLSTDSSFESTKTSYAQTLIDAENKKKNSEISVKNAYNNLENAKKNKDVTLRSLNNSIKEAQVALSEAQKNYSKLFITSPIKWVISEINVDLWQEVGAGSNMLTIVWNDSTQVELYLTNDETKHLSEWIEVKIDYLWKELNWKISSISSVATQDFTYKTIVTIEDKISIIWDYVEVLLPISLENTLFPINSLKIVDKSKAIIYKLTPGNTIEEISVDVWNTYWNYIEILTQIDPDTQVILTDVSNYDSEKFQLKIQE